MDVVQWIGFFISVMAMLFLLTRNLKEVRQEHSDPEEYQKRQRTKEKQLKKMLKTLDIDVEEEKIPPPMIKKPPKFSPKADHIPKSSIEIPIIKRAKPSRGKKLVRSPKEMMILREIIGPPKSLKPIPFHEYWS